MRWLAALALAVACSSNSSSPAPAPGPTSPPAPAPAPTPTPDPKPDPAPTADPKPDDTKQQPPAGGAKMKLHEKCTGDDVCETPAKCVKYYGIAGPRGPEFKTCEIKCDKSTKCPTGTSCGVVADGPGQTCR